MTSQITMISVGAIDIPDGDLMVYDSPDGGPVYPPLLPLELVLEFDHVDFPPSYFYHFEKAFLKPEIDNWCKETLQPIFFRSQKSQSSKTTLHTGEIVDITSWRTIILFESAADLITFKLRWTLSR